MMKKKFKAAAAAMAAILLAGCAGTGSAGAGARTPAQMEETSETTAAGTEETTFGAGAAETSDPAAQKGGPAVNTWVAEAFAEHTKAAGGVTDFNAAAEPAADSYWGTGLTAEEEKAMISAMHKGFLDAVIERAVSGSSDWYYDRPILQEGGKYWSFHGNLFRAAMDAARAGAVDPEDARDYVLGCALYTDALKTEAFKKIEGGLLKFLKESDAAELEEQQDRFAGMDSMSGGVLTGAAGSVPAAEAFAAPSAYGMMADSAAMAPAPQVLSREPVQDMTTPEAFNTAEYAVIRESVFKETALSPLSTFSANCSTAGYTKLKYDILRGRPIVKDQVKAEELINYFRYDYGEAEDGTPFAVSSVYTACPWDAEHRLLRVGIRAAGGRAPETTNFVLVADVSGSMLSLNKLPLALDAYAQMADGLGERGCVSLLYYADGSGVVLENASCADKARIFRALAELLFSAGGSTNGALGLETAYELAERGYADGGANRVIIATDGDFNIGRTGTGEVAGIAKEWSNKGIYLTILGYGFDNLKDNRMEEMARQGRGNYHFIGDTADAQKALVEEASATLLPVADDVKIQLEFNPDTVQSYRLIGYENDLLDAEAFADDAVQAGTVGQGTCVTALYEIVPAGGMDVVDGTAQAGTKQAGGAKPSAGMSGAEASGTQNSGHFKYSTIVTVGSSDICTISIRYKDAGSALTKEASHLIEKPVRGDSFVPVPDAGTAAAIAAAELALVLRDSPYKGSASAEGAALIAKAAAKASGDASFEEFAKLIETLIRQSL